MKPINYEKYFSRGQQAKIVLKLSSNRFLDRNAEISFVEKDMVEVEVLGDGVSEKELSKEIGAKVTFSVASGWGLFRCNGSLVKVLGSKHLAMKLSGEVFEQQRREYFRLDVDMAVLFSVPADQNIITATAAWNERRLKNLSREPVMAACGKGFKVIKWLGGDDILPQSVNLSGGGLRIKTREFIEPLALAVVDLFLPLAPTRVISTLAEVVRCNEIQLNWEKGTSYNTAFKFVKIEEKDRQTIITYVFSEQRSQLQATRDGRP